MDSKVTIGVIGAGRIGKLHAGHLALRIPEARVVAISDIVVEAAQQCAATLNIPKAVQDYHQI